MSEGGIGLGTPLKIGDGAVIVVFTAIAEVKGINGTAPLAPNWQKMMQSMQFVTEL